MCMRVAAEVEVKTGDVLSDNTALQLVLGLRNFILVVASSKVITYKCLVTLSYLNLLLKASYRFR